MAAILRYLTGNKTTVITITAQDVSAAGVLTDTASSTGTLTSGRCDGLNIVGRLNSDLVMSIDDTITNHVGMFTDYQFDLTEILVQKTGTGGVTASATNYEPILPYLFYKAASGTSTYEYFKIVVTKGGKTYTLYGIKHELSDGVNGQGKQVARMSLLPVNTNFDASGVLSLAYS